MSTMSPWYKTEGNSGKLSTVETGNTSFLYFFSFCLCFLFLSLFWFGCLFVFGFFYFVLRQCLTL